jgi:hypothetical protein
MSRAAEDSKTVEDPGQQKIRDAPRRKLSLANISIPTILKRKPLPINSPVSAARQRSLPDNSTSLNPNPSSARQPSNLLTPIPSPASVQLVLRDLDRYAIQSAGHMSKREYVVDYQLLIVVRIATLMAILLSQE